MTAEEIAEMVLFVDVDEKLYIENFAPKDGVMEQKVETKMKALF